MFVIERLCVRNDGKQDRAIVFESDDIIAVMRYWNSYASGINDIDPAYGDPIEFCNQNFSDAYFYRIFEKWN